MKGTSILPSAANPSPSSNCNKNENEENPNRHSRGLVGKVQNGTISGPSGTVSRTRGHGVACSTAVWKGVHTNDINRNRNMLSPCGTGIVTARSIRLGIGMMWCMGLGGVIVGCAVGEE